MLERFMQENISGNVTAIGMDNKNAIPLIMIRYEMIFNYLSEQIGKIIFTIMMPFVNRFIDM